MSSAASGNSQTEAIRACTVSRNIQNFDLLIEDMDAEFGVHWGDLSYQNALKYLDQPESSALELMVVVIEDEEPATMSQVQALVERARDRGIDVILIADQLAPIVLHRFLRLGAADFVPYPLPERALHEAIVRLLRPQPTVIRVKPPALAGASAARLGKLVVIHPLAGGVGATTLAVNLAWELANYGKAEQALRVCLMDFDLQTGSVATYLDLPRTEKVYELLTNTAIADRDFFLATLQKFNDRLHVLTAASDMLPLDLITPEDVTRILALARANFDFVVVDMPRTIVQWTETILNAADSYFTLIELDMRSAQNALRLIRALKAENLPHQKLRWLLNRAPRFTDLSGKARAKRIAESLDIRIEAMLSDGGGQVTQANDHGLPLAEFAARNALLRDIRKLALSLVEGRRAQRDAA